MSEPLEVGSEAWLQRVEEVRREELSESVWWYFSFTDPDLPKGTQFLGGLYIDAPNFVDALSRSHLLGLNPGGQIAFVPLPKDAFEENVPESMRRRLLSREEVESI